MTRARLLLAFLASLTTPLLAEDGFRRGDANADGSVDLSDPVHTLGFLFLGGPRAPCLDAADSNDDGAIDLSDSVHGLGFLFLGTPEPRPPFTACGADPTADRLDCASFPRCGPIPQPVVSASIPPAGGTIQAADGSGGLVVVVAGYAYRTSLALEGTAGQFVHLGTLRFALMDAGGAPGIVWRPEVRLSGVLHRATIVSPDYADHHPSLLAE